MRERRTLIVAVMIAILISSLASVYKFYIVAPPQLPHTIPTLGKEGSTHSHTSMYVMIGDAGIDLCAPRYMLKSQFVHFEDENCAVVHKHAKGVTLQTFFKTIGIILTPQCITIPEMKQECADDKNKITAVINGTEIPISELAYYELRNNDHVLVNYGPETGTMLRFKYNQIPPVPEDINKAKGEE